MRAISFSSSGPQLIPAPRSEQDDCFGRARDSNKELEDAPESAHVKRTAQDVFEAQLRRMTGHDDGICDALFDFTRPLTGGYYWCLPLGL